MTYQLETDSDSPTGRRTKEALPPEVWERLARRLFETEEHLDPEGLDWDGLDAHAKSRYFVCSEAVWAEYEYPSDISERPTTTSYGAIAHCAKS